MGGLILQGPSNVIVLYDSNEGYRPVMISISNSNKTIEHEVKTMVKAFIPSDALVFDVGANKGIKTDMYLDCGAKKVICFESQPECINILKSKFFIEIFL